MANISAGAAALTCLVVAIGPTDMHGLVVIVLAAYAAWHAVMAVRRGEGLLAMWTGVMVVASLLIYFKVPKPF